MKGKEYFMDVRIRTATIEDAEELLGIYAYYIKNTAVTFEYEVPSVEEFQGRISHILEHYPYLVAEADGEIIGYSYAGRFHPRAAFSWDVEMTVYLKHGTQRAGIGRKLYTLMERILREQGGVKTISLIVKPTDRYSDYNSVLFHEKMGYTYAGELKDCGYKFHRWYTLIYMDKQIGSIQEKMLPIRDFAEVRKTFGL